MSNVRERPFELLKKRTGEEFSNETIRNWYIARAFVLEKLKEKEEECPFSPDSNDYLHVVLMGDDGRMLSVARNVALYAHYLNFDEDCEDASYRRTVITIITQDSDIKNKLLKEEYLCNLPKYCKYVDGTQTYNIDSYVDIELRIVSDNNYERDGALLVFEKTEVDSFFNRVLDGDEDIFTIDTRKAFYAGEMYSIGETIDNLPAENIHNTKRYTMALNVFQCNKLKATPKPLFENLGEKQYKLKEALSNVFCSDCFESRANAIRHLYGKNLKNETELWEKYNAELSKSEHARWVVEKLIMGYRPLDEDERNHDETLRLEFNSNIKLKKYRNSLKRNDEILAHIDLCSYRDLRRINPNDLKYDSFLMLAIPQILKNQRL